MVRPGRVGGPKFRVFFFAISSVHSFFPFWGRRGFTRQLESPHVDTRGLRVLVFFYSRERNKKTKTGAREGKNSEIWGGGWSAEGGPVKGGLEGGFKGGSKVWIHQRTQGRGFFRLCRLRSQEKSAVDSEDDSDHDSGPESFVFDPVESDDELDSVIDALERDLEDEGASVADVEEVLPQVDKQDIPVGVVFRPRSKSIDFPDHVPCQPVVHARVQCRKGVASGSSQGGQLRWDQSWQLMSTGRLLCHSFPQR